MQNQYGISKTRSNRGMTQKLVNATNEYIHFAPCKHWEYGNTVAFVDDDGSFTIQINSNPILQLIASGEDVSRVRVYTGNRYDEDGNPYRVVQDRLNGIFHYLGEIGIIPTCVRVFRDKETNVCYLGHCDDKVAFTENYYQMVEFKCDPSDFVITDAHIARSALFSVPTK